MPETKCCELTIRIAKKDDGVQFPFSQSEGFHRRGGSSIQALTGSKIDSITGITKKPCDLTYQHVVDSKAITADVMPETVTSNVW